MSDLRTHVFDRDTYRLLVKNALKAAVQPGIDSISSFDAPLLEVGCGTGYLYRELLPDNHKTNYIGLDASEPALALFKKKRPGVFLSQGDISNLPFSDRTIGNVMGFSAYPPLINSESGFKEIYRVLKPGGRLVISQESGISDKSTTESLPPKHEYTEEYHQKVIKGVYDAGFNLVSGLKHGHGVAVVPLVDLVSRIPESVKPDYQEALKDGPVVGYSLYEGGGAFGVTIREQLKKHLRGLESEAQTPPGLLYRLKIDIEREAYEYVRVRYVVAEKPLS